MTRAGRSLQIPRSEGLGPRALNGRDPTLRERSPRSASWKGCAVPLFATVRWARHAASSSAAVLLLAACAAPAPKPVQKYVAPAAGQTAKLVMRGAVPAGDV